MILPRYSISGSNRPITAQPSSTSTRASNLEADFAVSSYSADSDLMFEFDDLPNTRPSRPMPVLPEPATRASSGRSSTAVMQQRAAVCIGRPLHITRSGRVDMVLALSIALAPPIHLTQCRDVYSLQHDSLPLPESYWQLQAALCGLQSLALNLLCGAGKVPLETSVRQLRHLVEEFVAQLSSANAMHQTLQRPGEYRQ